MTTEYAPGTRLSGGRYRVICEINRGGTAIVYAAIDATLGRQVALKVMQPQGTTASVNIVAVKREANFPYVLRIAVNDYSTC